MEEEPSASESDARELNPSHAVLFGPGDFTSPSGRSQQRRRSSQKTGSLRESRLITGLCMVVLALIVHPSPIRADALERIRDSGVLRYGSDMEGGGPYAYPDPTVPGGVSGFEVELMALLAEQLKVQATFSYGPWDKLLQLLDSRRVDLVINGYEWTEIRSRSYLATRPYYVYQLQPMARHGSGLDSWAAIKRSKPGGGRWKVAVLVASAADTYATEQGGDTVEVIHCDGSTDAMTLVQNGQCDLTLQDLPAARFYRDRFPTLENVGAPLSHGYYVIFTRNDEPELRDALDKGLERLFESGGLRKIYQKYGIWTEAQDELGTFHGPIPRAAGPEPVAGWALLRRYQSSLLQSAKVTFLLSVASMPIAMAMGLLIALIRMYGNRWLGILLHGYVEVIRGTPLMLQLYVLFFQLKLDPWVAGITGLAINYSAYEAEIYRAGLQAIPVGQMEAALALGMSRWMALRRVVVPQAVRMVIPPVTNDFIALFKDTSVCSVVTLVELTKQYSTLANSTGGAIEFALAAGTLYMLMSVPLSWFSRWSERYLGGMRMTGGALT